MWPLTACKISASLLFLNWVKTEIIFYRISELMLATLIQRYDIKSFHFKNETNWKFTGCQVPHLIIVLIPYIVYQFIKPFLDNKMSSIFEKYGAFNDQSFNDTLITDIVSFEQLGQEN